MAKSLDAKGNSFLSQLKNIIFLTVGAMITAFALESFLVPNNIIDGGVIGISMIASHITKWNLGLLILILNTPFIIMAFKKWVGSLLFRPHLRT